VFATKEEKIFDLWHADFMVHATNRPQHALECPNIKNSDAKK
jgi:hypothetical protein